MISSFLNPCQQWTCIKQRPPEAVTRPLLLWCPLCGLRQLLGSSRTGWLPNANWGRVWKCPPLAFPLMVCILHMCTGSDGCSFKPGITLLSLKALWVSCGRGFHLPLGTCPHLASTSFCSWVWSMRADGAGFGWETETVSFFPLCSSLRHLQQHPLLYKARLCAILRSPAANTGRAIGVCWCRCFQVSSAPCI